MNTSAVIDFSEVDRLFKNLGRQYSKDIVNALSATAQQGIVTILDRTEKGKGYESRFKRYSPEYAQSKAEGWPRTKTRRAFGGDPSGKVNLMVSGNMLSSIKSTVDKPKLTAEIGFSRATEAKKAYWNNQSRPFFGFNQREKNFLRKFFYKRLTK